MGPSPGTSIENYYLEDRIGQGGMGAVYRAVDTNLDRVVALKIMNPQLTSNADFLRRFKSEARVLGRLQHANIVDVYTFRHVDPHLVIVMEYVGGGALSELITREGPLSILRAIDLARQSLHALEFAHAANIIHRDIKPPNILLTENMQVKVSDFGLAKIQEDSSATMVTRVGMTGGTLHYMPPEQTESLSSVDHRGDLYSLGMTFYQMLAGRVPFEEKSSTMSILRIIDEQRIPPPNTFNPEIPQALVDIVMKAIDKYPDNRYQTAAKMRAAIDAFEQDYSNRIAESGLLGQVPADLGSTSTFYKPDVLARRQSKGLQTPAWVKNTQAPVSRSTDLKDKERASSSPSKKKWGILLGVLLLVAAGAFLLPRLFDASLGEEGDTLLSEQASTQPEEAIPAPINEEAIPQGGSQTEEEPVLVSPPPVMETPEEDGEVLSMSAPAQVRTVTVRSDPSGAIVRMNGRVVGETPLTLDNVPAQVQSFALSLDGYQTERLNMDVARQTVLTANLTSATGLVRVIVRPFGDIVINGSPKASGTSRTYEEALPVGTHTITARHPSLGNWVKEVTIRAGVEEDVLFNFADMYKVTILSQPTNATILVNGEPLMTRRGVMTTPRELQLPPGNHSITVKMQGFKVTKGPVNILLEEDIEEPIMFVLEVN